MLNDSGTRYKRSQVEKDINKDVVSCVIILFILCLIGAICKYRWFLYIWSFEQYYGDQELFTESKNLKRLLRYGAPKFGRTRGFLSIYMHISSHQMIVFVLGCSYWTVKNSTFEEVISTNMAEDSHVYEGFLRFWTFVIILQVNWFQC